MKKISAILLALALIVMACVPFSASAADEAFTYKIEVDEVVEGAETIKVTITLVDNDEVYPLNGGFILTYDPEAMEVVIPEGKRGPDADLLTELPNCAVNVMEENVDPEDENSPKVPTGEIKIGFMSELEETETVVFKGTFKLAAAAEVGTEYNFAIESYQLVLYEEGNLSGIDIIAGGAVLADEVTVVAEAAPTTTAAPTTAAPTTAAPTTAAPTTKAPVAGGEATPWALMATVAVAGAALVVLSTKKSK